MIFEQTQSTPMIDSVGWSVGWSVRHTLLDSQLFQYDPNWWVMMVPISSQIYMWSCLTVGPFVHLLVILSVSCFRRCFKKYAEIIEMLKVAVNTSLLKQFNTVMIQVQQFSSQPFSSLAVNEFSSLGVQQFRSLAVQEFSS